MKRFKLSKRANKASFAKSASKTKRINYSSTMVRGGQRL